MNDKKIFTRQEVERSFRKFHDIVDDLFNAQFQTWPNMFTHLITHCETDSVMKVITGPLKDDPRVEAEKWFLDAIKSVKGMVGSGSYSLPTDDDERTALLYQVFLGVEYEKYDILRFNQSVFGHSGYQDIIDTFNQELVLKFTREVKYRLEEIMAENNGLETIPREAMIVFHHHDLRQIYPMSMVATLPLEMPKLTTHQFNLIQHMTLLLKSMHLNRLLQIFRKPINRRLSRHSTFYQQLPKMILPIQKESPRLYKLYPNLVRKSVRVFKK